MPGTDERVEDSRADVTGRAGEKDPHASVTAYINARAFDHNPPVARETLLDFFHDLARARGEFLVYDDGFRRRGYSYAEVAQAAGGFAERLAAFGLRKGDKVVFWSENRPEWIVAFWGCLLGPKPVQLAGIVMQHIPSDAVGLGPLRSPSWIDSSRISPSTDRPHLAPR